MYEGGTTIPKRQISQKIFTSEFMLPDSKGLLGISVANIDPVDIVVTSLEVT